MRRMYLWLAISALVIGSGCHRDKYNLSAKFEEEYVLPPDEPRFNDPPESGYRKSPKKRDTDVRNMPGGFGGGSRNGSGFNAGGVPGGR